jgi:hypothetical protein
MPRPRNQMMLRRANDFSFAQRATRHALHVYAYVTISARHSLKLMATKEVRVARPVSRLGLRTPRASMYSHRHSP